MILATAERAIPVYCASRVNCSPNAVYSADGNLALVRAYYEYQSPADELWTPCVMAKANVEQVHCMYARGRKFKVSMERGIRYKLASSLCD